MPAIAKEAGVEVIIRTRRTLYDPDKIVKRNGNKLTMSMSQVQKVASTLGEPTKPLRAPTSLPDLREIDLSSIDHEIPAPEPDFNTGHHTAGKEDQYKSVIGFQKKDFAVPTLAEMGTPTATTLTETLALSKLAELCSDSTYISTFEKKIRTQTSSHSPRPSFRRTCTSAPSACMSSGGGCRT
jgi:cryptochrome